MAFGCQLAGAVQAVETDVGDLAVACVCAHRFAERLLITGHVQDVVDDLEQQAEFVGERTERDRNLGLGAGIDDGASHGRCDQAAGLEQVDLTKRVSRFAAVVAQVKELPADHSVDTRGRSEFGDDAESRRRPARLPLSDEADGLGEQRVARQDRRVLAERAVARRPPAAQVVVVHRRQVVVDQRVGVDQLKRGRCGKQFFGLVAQALAGRQAQHRPDALAARQQRVPHGFDEPLRAAHVELCLGAVRRKVEGLEERLDERA